MKWILAHRKKNTSELYGSVTYTKNSISNALPPYLVTRLGHFDSQKIFSLKSRMIKKNPNTKIDFTHTKPARHRIIKFISLERKKKKQKYFWQTKKKAYPSNDYSFGKVHYVLLLYRARTMQMQCVFREFWLERTARADSTNIENKIISKRSMYFLLFHNFQQSCI